ncbi:hypothetical protein GCM10010975_26820 [Comamonas phosphati]|nr:hypothetical protein GCM10010975_26820 [Comamonas phosphati]
MADIDSITITLESLPAGRVAVHTSLAEPRPGERVQSPGHAMALEVLTWLNKQPNTAGTIYDPSQILAPTQKAADALQLVNSLLNPEQFGYSVSAEVRNAARRVLGIKGREGLAA